MTLSYLNTLCAAIAAVLIVATPVQDIRAQMPVIDGANLIQNYLNGAQEVLTAARTLQSNINEAQMIANELLNLRNLPQQIINSYLARFQHILLDVQNLTQLVGRYDNLSQAFAVRYPNFRGTNGSQANLFTLQAQWGDEHRQNLVQAMQQGAGILKDLRSAVGDTQFMASSSQGAVGALQAIQAGNQLTMRVNDDLQRLNTQVATFNGVVLEKMAREQSEDDATEAIRKHLHAHDRDPYLPNPVRDPRY
jgi:P-type conjugative transfer protein TrbJ